MKKSTLMLIIGAAVAFFGYRYFLKVRSTAKAAPSPTTTSSVTNDNTKGTIIVPDEPSITTNLVAQQPTKTVPVEGDPSTIQYFGRYIGPAVYYDSQNKIVNGDKIVGYRNSSTTFTITQIFGVSTYKPKSLTVNQEDIQFS